jgi:hypothetical protein
MSEFTDYVLSDLTVFFNEDEIGEKHTIGSKECTVIIDESAEEKQKNTVYFGTFNSVITVYIKASDLPSKPKPDEYIDFDHVPYSVIDSNGDSGVYKLVLGASVS